MNILITGATSGIGKQVALDYAAAGHHVIAVGRNDTALQELAQRYAEQISGCQLDIGDRDACLQTLRAFTDIDIVILSAGVCEYLAIDEFDSALFERVFQVNVIGTMNCVQGLLPNLKAGSKLVFVGSTARLLPFVKAEAYGASKAAIHYIARSLEVDLASRGIKVLTVSPGFVETPMTDVNEFEMPMKVSVEYASQAIRRGIEKNTRDITFPRLFGGLLKVMSRFPQGWQIALAKRFAKSY